MLHSLQMIFERLINETSMTHHRFLYQKINMTHRLTGLIGPRGVGKTTLMLQLIKEHYTNRTDVRHDP